MSKTAKTVILAVSAGAWLVLLPSVAGADAKSCNGQAHGAGPFVRDEGTGGSFGAVSSGFARELGGIGQFTGPGSSGAAADCRAAR